MCAALRSGGAVHVRLCAWGRKRPKQQQQDGGSWGSIGAQADSAAWPPQRHGGTPSSSSRGKEGQPLRCPLTDGTGWNGAASQAAGDSERRVASLAVADSPASRRDDKSSWEAAADGTGRSSAAGSHPTHRLPAELSASPALTPPPMHCAPPADEHFRLVYDAKGRFVVHRITKEEASYKLCKVRRPAVHACHTAPLCVARCMGAAAAAARHTGHPPAPGLAGASHPPAASPPSTAPPQVKRMAFGKGGIPHIGTHDGRTVRYPDPEIKVGSGRAGGRLALLLPPLLSPPQPRLPAIATQASLPLGVGRTTVSSVERGPPPSHASLCPPSPLPGERHGDAGPGDGQDQGLHQVRRGQPGEAGAEGEAGRISAANHGCCVTLGGGLLPVGAGGQGCGVEALVPDWADHGARNTLLLRTCWHYASGCT